MKQIKSVLGLLEKFAFLYSIILLFKFTTALNQTTYDQLATTYLVSYCSDYGHYDEGSEFQSNLDLLTSNFTVKSNTTKFSNFTAGGTTSTSTVYGLFLCNSVISNDACNECVTTAIVEIQQRCSFSREYIVWYAGCMVRYSDLSIFSFKDTSLYYIIMAPPTDYSEFNLSLSKAFIDLFSKATTGDTLSLPSELSVVDVAENVSLTSYVDCTPDLNNTDCDSCLKTALSRLPKLGARVGGLLQPSCRLMYEFNDTRPPTPGNTTKKGSCKQQNIGIGIISAIAIASLVLNTCDYFMRRKTIVKPSGLDNIETRENLNFDIAAIKEATNNFSSSNELGRGGFGVVYKGTLQDGKTVAVKRLSNASRQGMREFKTEACLAAKLQHKNLVKVYGFCMEEDEMLLVYEYVPNKSLDRFLFDEKQRDSLSWEFRYKITVGIARGLAYLHEDSDPKIIHRDLKPSNILLDVMMNPKLADFGLAKMFGEDQSHGDTSRVAGTFGYMAPEYVTAGKFSNKSDIFSYGVILLEIISGKRNNFSEPNSPDDNLLNYAWRLWNEGDPLMLIDSAIKTNLPKNEAERCIQVGLMCIQDDPSKRPNIDSVLLMLHAQPVSVLDPASPPAFPYNRAKQDIQHEGSQSLLDDTLTELSAR